MATQDKNFRVKNGIDAGGSVTANSFIKTGGTSSQYLLADGTVTTNGGGIKSTYSATAPVSPSVGDIWIDTTDGTSLTYINDGNSSQWVELNVVNGVLGLGASISTFLDTPSSANLAAAVTDETGSGALVFGTSPTVTGGTFADAVIRQSLLTPTFTTNAYTLALTDQGDILLASNGATAGTINIPTNASVAFPTGTQITVIQTGSGQITIQATTPGTTTIASTGVTTTAPKLRAINASATLIKTNTDTWYVVGDIS